jgi:hypothetical protein
MYAERTLCYIPDKASVTEQTARRLIREIVNNQRIVILTDHFEQEQREEWFEEHDYIAILGRGTIVNGPHYRARNGKYRVEVAGKSYDDRMAKLVLDLAEEAACCIVTIHEPSE